MKIMKIDYNQVAKYIEENKDKPIYKVYNEIKKKKKKDRTNEEIIVYTYLSLNKRRLGIK